MSAMDDKALDDLVYRLRRYRISGAIECEAAAAITQLRSEHDRLRSDYDGAAKQYRDQIAYHHDRANSAMTEIAELKQQINAMGNDIDDYKRILAINSEYATQQDEIITQLRERNLRLIVDGPSVIDPDTGDEITMREENYRQRKQLAAKDAEIARIQQAAMQSLVDESEKTAQVEREAEALRDLIEDACDWVGILPYSDDTHALIRQWLPRGLNAIAQEGK